MTVKKRQFHKGIRIKPDADALGTDEGEIKVDSGDNKIKARLGSTNKEVITNDQTQTLENKTIDATAATGNNTLSADASDITYDNATSGLTATDAQAAIDELKTGLDNQNEASEIAYSNATSGLTATNVQAAIDEVEGRVDTVEAAQPTGAVVGTTDTQTLTNKTIVIDDDKLTIQDEVDNTKKANFQLSGLTTATTRTYTMPDADTTIVGIDTTDTLSNKTLDNSNVVTVQDTNLTVQDNGDNTKQAKFDASGITTATTRTYTLPDADTTLVGSDTTQTLTNKTITIDDANFTIQDDGDTSKKAQFQASGITTATTRTLTIPDADTTIVGTDATQTLTNKTISAGNINSADIDGQTASNTSRITLPKAAKATLDGLTRKQATLLYDTDSDKVYLDNGSALVELGAGGGTATLATFVQITNEVDADAATNWSTGNNATFLGGGSLAGTLADDSSTPLNGTASYTFTQAAGSLNDYIASPVKDVPIRSREQLCVVKLSYTYDGADDDIKAVVWDATNSTDLLNSSGLIKSYSGSRKTLTEFFFVPSTCTQIRAGFQVQVANSGKILEFDDIELIDEPGVQTSIGKSESAVFDIITGLASSNTRCVYFTNERENTVSEFATITNDSTDGWKLVANKSCLLNLSYGGRDGGGTKLGVTRNPTAGQRDTDVGSLHSTNPDIVVMLSDDGSGAQTAAINGSVHLKLVAGDEIYIQSGSTAPTSGSLTVTLLGIGYEGVVTQESEAINTFSAIIANNGTATITSQGPVDFIQSVSRTSAGVVAITWKSGFFTTAPAVNLTPLEDNRIISISSSTPSSTTGVGTNLRTSAGAATDHDFYITVERQGTDARSPLQPRLNINPVTILKEVQTAGTAGGTFTSGSQQTRTLNTKEEIGGAFVTLSSNQFTLSAGTYELDGSAPALQVDSHQTIIRNITDSTNDIIGTPEEAPSGTAVSNRSKISGFLEITSQKTFELQHICDTTKATNGFGDAANLGNSEVYSILKIKKIR